MIPKTIKRELEATGHPWSVDKGKRHLKVRLCGRMVGILPGDGKGHSADRAAKNIVAQIRRAARDLR